MSVGWPALETWSVVVWNLNEARSRKSKSWRVLDAMQADVALLNEARVHKAGSSGYVRGGKSTLGRDDKSRSWATAVISPYELGDPVDVWTTDAWGKRRAPLANARPGSWTAAVVPIPDVGDVTAIALYGLLDEKSDASVHRSLSDLTPLFEDRRYNERLLLGGDLNTWTGWAAGSHLARDETALQRIKAFGFVDCLVLALTRDQRGPLVGCPCGFGDACTHTRTRLDHNNPEIPYQMDYLYASPDLAERLVTCEAVDLGENSPSDHFPIRTTFRK